VSARFAVPSLLALAALPGCASFATVDEACESFDSVPGEQFVTRPADVELLQRTTCYRRTARKNRLRVIQQVQNAVENHRDYLEANAPDPLSIFNESQGMAQFTGASASARLEDAGYAFPGNAGLLELATSERGEAFANVLQGADYVDFWFDVPTIRPAWLQPEMLATGVSTGSYVQTFPNIDAAEDIPVSFQYWNLIYGVSTTPYAEPAIEYPANGQTDVPPSYTHLTSSSALEFGRTYGYPVTFTVGSTETGLTIDSAAIIGPEGAVAISVLTGEDALTFGRLTNTAIVIPDSTLQAGAEYTASVKITTDQGTRRATTTFRTGGQPREIPFDFQARIAEERPLRMFARWNGEEWFALDGGDLPFSTGEQQP
jgi:hypothetical protein